MIVARGHAGKRLDVVGAVQRHEGKGVRLARRVPVARAALRVTVDDQHFVATKVQRLREIGGQRRLSASAFRIENRYDRHDTPLNFCSTVYTLIHSLTQTRFCQLPTPFQPD